MKIRESTRDDMQAISDLVRDWDRDTGLRYATRSRGPVSDREFVAENSGQIVGWISGNHRSDSWGNLAAYEARPDDWVCSYIVKLFVHPQMRSRDIGRRLVDTFERDARAAGRDLVVVFPDESDDLEKVRRFYRSKCGYTLMAPSTDHAGMQPWLMAKSLSA